MGLALLVGMAIKVFPLRPGQLRASVPVVGTDRMEAVVDEGSELEEDEEDYEEETEALVDTVVVIVAVCETVTVVDESSLIPLAIA